MKKILLFSAILLGTTMASRADVDVHIGFPLPPLPRIVIGHPAPHAPVVVGHPYRSPIVVNPPHHHYPPPQYHYPPPVVCAPPVYAPPHRVVYVPRHRHCGHFRIYGECRHYRHH